jgi:hypothetical protein
VTPAARTALIDIGTNRQGATPPAKTDAAVLHELTTLGILGVGNGLTRRGTIKREQVMNDLLDDIFG